MAFISAVSRHEVAIVSTAPLLQEIIGAERHHPGKYAIMRDLMFRTTGSRWLKPLNERHTNEAIRGGLLPIGHRYLNREFRRDLEKMAKRREDIKWVADAVHDQINEFKTKQERIRSLARAELADGVPLDDADLRKNMNEWWAGLDIASWVRDMAEAGVTKGLFPPGDSCLRDIRSSYPSVWHFTSFKLARIKLNLGDRRAIHPSDYVDAEHYACGAYFDVLVTDDRAFRHTADIIPDCPFAIEGHDEFVTRFTSR